MRVEPIRKLEGLETTITVQVTRELRFRVWLSIRLFRLAMWVLGGKCAIVVEDEKPASRVTLH